MIKNYFDENFVVSVEDGNSFKSTNKCWRCYKLIAARNIKVIGHDEETRKCRVSAHWNCNNDLKLTKIVPLIFHKFKGFDNSNLIIQ